MSSLISYRKSVVLYVLDMISDSPHPHPHHSSIISPSKQPLRVREIHSLVYNLVRPSTTASPLVLNDVWSMLLTLGQRAWGNFFATYLGRQEGLHFLLNMVYFSKASYIFTDDTYLQLLSIYIQNKWTDPNAHYTVNYNAHFASNW
jgi:hypothetical protein